MEPSSTSLARGRRLVDDRVDRFAGRALSHDRAESLLAQARDCALLVVADDVRHLDLARTGADEQRDSRVALDQAPGAGIGPDHGAVEHLGGALLLDRRAQVCVAQPPARVVVAESDHVRHLDGRRPVRDEQRDDRVLLDLLPRVGRLLEHEVAGRLVRAALDLDAEACAVEALRRLRKRLPDDRGNGHLLAPREQQEGADRDRRQCADDRGDDPGVAAAAIVGRRLAGLRRRRGRPVCDDRRWQRGGGRRRSRGCSRRCHDPDGRVDRRALGVDGPTLQDRLDALQRLDERVRVGVALGRVLGKRLHDDRLQRDRHRRLALARRGRWLVDVLQCHGDRAVAAEGRAPGEQLEQHDPDGVQVRRLRHAGAPEPAPATGTAPCP